MIYRQPSRLIPVAVNAGFEPRDRAAYFAEVDVLVVADLHLGRARSANIDFPVGETGRMMDRLVTLLERYEPAEVVFAGDVLHAFSYVPDGVEAAIGELRDTVLAAGAAPVVVSGNHDTMLESFTDPVEDYSIGEGMIICHGHEEPSTSGTQYIIGHEHPAIDIAGRRRPCFLVGRGVYNEADVIVLPAFNQLAVGTEINGMTGEDTASPLLAELESFRPIVCDSSSEETLAFPPLADLREYLS